MNLRTKLLLGYGYLVGLLLLAAGSAMLGFLTLSEGIDVVLDNNYRSIRASMDMVDALERQDSATLAALLDDPGQESLEPFEQAFAEALATARGNVTEPREPEILDTISRQYEGYRNERDELVRERPERPLASYRERVSPQFAALKHTVLQLLEVNQEAMVGADRRARESAIRNGSWLGFVVALALVSLVVLSRALQRQILGRLTTLRRGTAALAEGDTTRRLAVGGSDELDLISERVNHLLDRLQAVESELRGKLSRQRQLVLGLLSQLGQGAALFSMQGTLLGGDLGGGRESALRVAEWIQGRQLDSETHLPDQRRGTVDTADGELGIELVTLHSRPLAWLVRPTG
ncbi:MAG: HAMP domain-containing protein [Thermoanaerobaculia bacterium]